jgi:L,D-transpeptidase catalytic domain
MSTSRAQASLLSAPRISLAVLALAAALSTGADGARDPRALAAAETVANAVAVQAVPGALAPLAPAVVAPAVDLLDAAIDRLSESAPELHREVLRLALTAREEATKNGLARKADLLTVIDYSLPSTAKRLWVFDVATGKVLFNELVAHGKNTGDNYAHRFSNNDGSLQTSLGVFRTAGTYTGSNGYSLKLDGLEPGFNDKAARRAVVMHGAPYVSSEFASQHGRIGRSWGCPALSQAVAPKVIDTIKGGSLVVSYFPDQDWLTHSRFLGTR